MPIDFFAMSDPYDKDEKRFFVHLIDNPVVSTFDTKEMFFTFQFLRICGEGISAQSVNSGPDRSLDLFGEFGQGPHSGGF